jgi:hypothetical protein
MKKVDDLTDKELFALLPAEDLPKIIINLMLMTEDETKATFRAALIEKYRGTLERAMRDD